MRCAPLLLAALFSATAVAQTPAEVPGNRLLRLERSLKQGDRELTWTAEHGYLESLLELFEVPRESQVLVFSKTSLQNDRIGPRRPRAIYFSDDVYIGWVQGGALMEITVIDPERGPLFFSLEQKAAARPEFLRETDRCLRCHASPAVDDLPSNLIRSVHPDSRGLPSMKNGSFLTTHESPLAERWGGWYVSGSTGGQPHMGNRTADPITERVTPAGSDHEDLKQLFDPSPYLTPHSDVVALMVLEHQAELQNRLSHARYRVLEAIARDAAMAADGDVKVSSTTRRRIRTEADRILRYLMFSDEPGLTAKVTGPSGFRARYEAAGPRDRVGRSLRQLDLKRRLFRYPCSPGIYSRSFAALPKPLLAAVYKKLWRVLIGKTRRAPYNRIRDADRTAVLEILLATKSGLPAYWRER